MNTKNNYCIIMAGGIGSRFWPLSKSSMPKQFLDILGTGKTLIQMTFERLKKICPVPNFIIVTNLNYKDLVLKQIPELEESQVLLEPLRRNTAPCIIYACNKIKMINTEANIIVAPSDHLIIQEEEFIKQLENGLKFTLQNDVLLTLGITPHKPETGYGYIQIDDKTADQQIKNLYKVKTFTEKPNIEMAKVFLQSGEFYWNSGIFIWSLKSILKAFDKYLFDIAELFRSGEKLYGTKNEVHFINKIYPECQNISIDYGIMEKADNVYVLCGDFGWSDLGTWGSLYENKEKDKNSNAIRGKKVFMYNSKNCMVHMPDNKTVAIEGLDGYIVVESDNTLLVCHRENEQQIRQFENDIRIKNK